jgi:hypothetical protein
VIADNTHIGLPTAAVAVLPTVTSDDARCIDTRPSGTSVRAHGAQSACGQIEYRMGTLTVLCARTLYPNYICMGCCTPQRVRVRRLREGEGVTTAVDAPRGARHDLSGRPSYTLQRRMACCIACLYAATGLVSHVCMLQPDRTRQDRTGTETERNETKPERKAGHRKATQVRDWRRNGPLRSERNGCGPFLLGSAVHGLGRSAVRTAILVCAADATHCWRHAAWCAACAAYDIWCVSIARSTMDVRCTPKGCVALHHSRSQSTTSTKW